MGLISLIILYFLVYFILSNITTQKDFSVGGQPKTIYVHGNDIHIDIIIPSESIPMDLRQQILGDETVDYISFGWGDQGFYTEVPS